MVILVTALVVLAVLGTLMVFSMAKVAGDADRRWEQLMFESQTGLRGDSVVG